MGVKFLTHENICSNYRVSDILKDGDKIVRVG